MCVDGLGGGGGGGRRKQIGRTKIERALTKLRWERRGRIRCRSCVLTALTAIGAAGYLRRRLGELSVDVWLERLWERPLGEQHP